MKFKHLGLILLIGIVLLACGRQACASDNNDRDWIRGKKSWRLPASLLHPLGTNSEIPLNPKMWPKKFDNGHAPHKKWRSENPGWSQACKRYQLMYWQKKQPAKKLQLSDYGDTLLPPYFGALEAFEEQGPGDQDERLQAIRSGQVDLPGSVYELQIELRAMRRYLTHLETLEGVLQIVQESYKQHRTTLGKGQGWRVKGSSWADGEAWWEWWDPSFNASEITKKIVEKYPQQTPSKLVEIKDLKLDRHNNQVLWRILRRRVALKYRKVRLHRGEAASLSPPVQKIMKDASQKLLSALEASLELKQEVITCNITIDPNEPTQYCIVPFLASRIVCTDTGKSVSFSYKPKFKKKYQSVRFDSPQYSPETNKYQKRDLTDTARLDQQYSISTSYLADWNKQIQPVLQQMAGQQRFELQKDVPVDESSVIANNTMLKKNPGDPEVLKVLRQKYEEFYEKIHKLTVAVNTLYRNLEANLAFEYLKIDESKKKDLEGAKPADFHNELQLCEKQIVDPELRPCPGVTLWPDPLASKGWFPRLTTEKPARPGPYASWEYPYVNWDYEVIDFSFNKLTGLIAGRPYQFPVLSGALKRLKLSGNQIQNLRFLSDLTNLENLDVSNNQLQGTLELPMNWNKLKALNVSNNQVIQLTLMQQEDAPQSQVIPQKLFGNLEVLDLSSNSLKKDWEIFKSDGLQNWHMQMKKLGQLILSNNPQLGDLRELEESLSLPSRCKIVLPSQG